MPASCSRPTPPTAAPPGRTGRSPTPWRSAPTPSSGSVRQRFVELGLEAALDRKQRERPPREVKLDGRAEARLIALACSAPPDGRAVWTMQLLADKLVELEVVDSISDETVRLALKKTS